VKLFYNEHHLYGCFSQNWGSSKGIDHFEDVCIVLNNSSWAKHRKDSLKALAPITKNKLYVACSRARGNLFLIQGSLLANFKTKKETRG
jgi:DNA helicase II / ATP-dependent DNA helicase PcrA